jgi:hypothetical protein
MHVKKRKSKSAIDEESFSSYFILMAILKILLAERRRLVSADCSLWTHTDGCSNRDCGDLPRHLSGPIQTKPQYQLESF